MVKERDILKMIWTNFVKSLKPRQISGNLIGQDNFGNKYYEIPADRSIGKKGSRWFVPAAKDGFDAQMPSEWEAWLRNRRQTPPTIEEITRNLTIMQDARKAAEEKGYVARDKAADPNKVLSFPKYDDYEIAPGARPKKD